MAAVVRGRGSRFGSAPAPPPSLIRADHEGVVIETVKWSEDGRGLIVRLQESMRQRGDVTLSTAFQE